MIDQSRGGRPGVLSQLAVSPAAFSFVVTLLGAAFSWLVVRPTVGIDDANITQVYAAHISQGHGYVYNIGGERVEGSTSLLWTLINVLPFLATDNAEPILAVVCFGLTFATVFLGIRTAEMLLAQWSVAGVQARIGAGAAYLLFPTFFLWNVWALMDLTLWVLALTALVHLSLRLVLAAGGEDKARLRRDAFLFALIAAVLPAVRPEGVAVSLAATVGVCIYLAIVRQGWGALVVGAGILLAAATFAGLTLWRLSYFGYPAPNTFYAKVSAGLGSQFIAGFQYGLKYVSAFPNTLIIGVSVALAVYGWSVTLAGPDDRRRRDAALVPLVFLAGLFLMYAVLGGDHFAAARFFQPATAVLAPISGAAVIAIWNAAVRPGLRYLLPASAALVLLFAAEGLRFVGENGGFGHEFRIATLGRSQGRILNTLPGAPPSLGVYMAGGIARTYRGPIYDVLGLNWTKMAHADHDLTGTIRNHGAFNEHVFLEAAPDILLLHSDEPGRCLSSADWPDMFSKKILKGLLNRAEFKDRYLQACYQGVQVFARRDFLAAHPGVFETPL